MSQGYAGLSIKRKDSKPPFDDPESAESTVREARSRYGGLHVVEVERRGPELHDLARYQSRESTIRVAYPMSKRVFDLVGASMAILILSPIILLLVACSFTTGGSPFFKHRRVGQGGVFFECLKFRTMVRNADQVLQNLLDSDHEIKQEWLCNHKLKDDPRVTRFGRFLRKTSLDELPQLWNVLRGEMSLVGPRPVVPDELRRYGKRVATFLVAKPGITGLWQVSGRNNIDYPRRVALDVCYIRSRNLKLDMYILIKTLPAVFAKNGAY